MDESTGNRLAALFDMSGHFTIAVMNKHKPRRTYSCQAFATAPSNDTPFLERFATATQLGTITTSSGSARWNIYGKDDVVRLTKLLTQYPLWSNKNDDFQLWREAVRYWNFPQYLPELSERGRPLTDWEPIIEIREELIRRHTPDSGIPRGRKPLTA